MDGLTLGKKALALFRSVRGAESLNDQCQRFSGYYTQWAYQGHEGGIKVYASANLAGDAAPRNGYKINECPVGGFFYWSVGQYGHVGMCIGYDGGRALVLHTAQGGDTVLKLDPSLKVSHADTYPQTFRHWSYTNGTNPRMSITGWSPNAPLKPNERIAGPKGVHARLDPNISRPSQGLVGPGAVVPMSGFRRDGENVAGNAIWYRGANGLWYWSGGFTSITGEALTDLTPAPVPTPVPPVEPEPTPEPVEPEPQPEPEPVPPVEPEPEPEPEPEVPAEPEPEPTEPEPEIPVEPEPETPVEPKPSKPTSWGVIVGVIVGAILGIIGLLFGGN